MKRTASAFPDIVSAMGDDRLFGPMFAGPSWDNWRTVLRGAFALPMSPSEREFFRSVSNREPPGKRVKELDIIAGRRSGKDSVASAIAAYAAVTFRSSGKVRPGERPLVMLLGADRAQARSLLNYVKGYFAEIAPFKAMLTREVLDGVELSTGIDILVSTADYRATRGRTILLAIFNEGAFWPSENSASPDVETFRAVQPSLATLGDEAMTIMISSAYKRSGLLYDRWKRFYGTDDANTLVIHARTTDLNPTISQATIDAALADDPESAKAEWLSLWRDDLAGYIDRITVEACVDFGITMRSRQSGFQYTSWIDASSGQSKDSMCGCVGHREGDTCVIDVIIEIKPPFDPASAVAQIATTLKGYGITRTIGDRWALGFVANEFSRHGIVLEYSDKNRSDIYREALPIIRSKRARLLDSDRMVNQFCNLERRAMPGGGERIDHPQRGGHHDDVVLVVCGCLVALASPVTGAEAIIEHYRRMVEEPGRFRGNTDFDDFRTAGPEFNWQMSSEPLRNVYLPPTLAAGVPDVRFMEGKPYRLCTRSEAKSYLSRPAIAALNPDLCRELEKTP
jgi:hypothetical protein